jgi:hypothetical protein
MPQSSWYSAVDNLYQQDKEKFLKLLELKAEIIRETMNDNCEDTKTVLTLGFNPMLFYICDKNDSIEYHMACFNQADVDFCANHPDLQHIITHNIADLTDEKFDIVVALDSFFTRFSDEDAQRNAINKAFSLTGKTMVTTVKDFKNMKSVDRLIDPPMVINTKEGAHVFVNHREWDNTDKQKFKETLYQLSNGDLQVVVVEEKRTLYFKQLAKYIHDQGCREFKISQSQFYKNLFSRSYEYIAVAKK